MTRLKRGEKIEQLREKAMLDFMADPRRWSCWPWLPMRRRQGSDLQLGFIHADPKPNEMTKVYKGNVFEVRSYFATKEMEVWDTFPNHEAIVAAGWEVD